MTDVANTDEVNCLFSVYLLLLFIYCSDSQARQALAAEFDALVRLGTERPLGQQVLLLLFIIIIIYFFNFPARTTNKWKRSTGDNIATATGTSGFCGLLIGF